MVFVFDLDGVLYQFLPALLNRLYVNHGIHIEPDSVTDQNIALLADSPASLVTIKSLLRSPPFYGSLTPYPDALPALSKLHTNLPSARFISLTSRPQSAYAATQYRLDTDFGHLFARNPDRSIICHHIDTKRADDKKKARAAKVYRARYAFEDHPGLAAQYAAHRIHTFVPARPYNSNLPRSRFLHRVSDLLEATDIILQRENKKETTSSATRS